MKHIYRSPMYFLGLYLSAIASAQTASTLLVTTDRSCNWKLDGQSMGLLQVGDPKVVPVLPGSHVIEAVAPDGVAIIRTEVKIEQGQKAVDIQPKIESAPPPKMEQVETARGLDPTDATQTWTDRGTRLIWTKKDNGSDLDWSQAGSYCSKLQLAGYSDWRLPSIDELQGIYDHSMSIKSVFTDIPDLPYGVHAKGNLQLTGWEWSSSQGDAPGQPWQVAWMLAFNSEKPKVKLPLGFHFGMRALCVRPSGE